MKTMFILISHSLTPYQHEDARKNWGIQSFRKVPNRWWGQIPADAESVLPYLKDIVSFLSEEARAGDLLLIQGDFGATVAMTQWARAHRLVPVYATTRRVARERTNGDQVITTREFQHIRFRPYELNPGYTGAEHGDKK
jgi:hypothetical protein